MDGLRDEEGEEVDDEGTASLLRQTNKLPFSRIDEQSFVN